MTLIVMKTLERVYKNYYFIIRGYKYLFVVTVVITLLALALALVLGNIMYPIAA